MANIPIDRRRRTREAARIPGVDLQGGRISRATRGLVEVAEQTRRSTSRTLEGVRRRAAQSDDRVMQAMDTARQAQGQSYDQLIRSQQQQAASLMDIGESFSGMALQGMEFMDETQRQNTEADMVAFESALKRRRREIGQEIDNLGSGANFRDQSEEYIQSLESYGQEWIESNVRHSRFQGQFERILRGEADDMRSRVRTRQQQFDYQRNVNTYTESLREAITSQNRSLYEASLSRLRELKDPKSYAAIREAAEMDWMDEQDNRAEEILLSGLRALPAGAPGRVMEGLERTYRANLSGQASEEEVRGQLETLKDRVGRENARAALGQMETLSELDAFYEQPETTAATGYLTEQTKLELQGAALRQRRAIEQAQERNAAQVMRSAEQGALTSDMLREMLGRDDARGLPADEEEEVIRQASRILRRNASEETLEAEQDRFDGTDNPAPDKDNPLYQSLRSEIVGETLNSDEEVVGKKINNRRVRRYEELANRIRALDGVLGEVAINNLWVEWFHMRANDVNFNGVINPPGVGNQRKIPEQELGLRRRVTTQFTRWLAAPEINATSWPDMADQFDEVVASIRSVYDGTDGENLSAQEFAEINEAVGKELQNVYVGLIDVLARNQPEVDLMPEEEDAPPEDEGVAPLPAE